MARLLKDSNKLPDEILSELLKTVWGHEIKEAIFERWSQGFMFSDEEPTALVQLEGGPCAVLAPVQGFILKHALTDMSGKWRKASLEQRDFLLRKAMLKIMQQCKQADAPYFHVHEDELSLLKDPISGSAQLHGNLWMRKVEDEEELDKIYFSESDILQRNFAVILFLYSVVLTKGISSVKKEMSDPSEALIDVLHGHGSQSLINLLLTGNAASHVWDNDRNISGLSFHGITKQSQVGFLTLLEHLHYCEVGWFLKSPAHPIWVLGSETHLTVLFSEDSALVGEDSDDVKARRVFKSYDPEGNNFISSALLGDVLQQLGLVSEPEYVEVMKKELDSDNLGIILLNSFLEEFYSNYSKKAGPDTFTVYHYNGLKQSHPDSKIKYQEGSAILLECDIKCVLDSNPIQTCLQTKWPSIEIQWTSGNLPSLN